MIQVSEVVRADDGYGFNITNGYSVPLVHFNYDREQDAIAAVKQVRVAISRAKSVKPQRMLD